MKKRTMLSAALCLTLLFTLLSGMSAGAVYAKESRAAIVTSVEGTVMVMKAGGSNEYRAFADMSLSQGDHIRTEEGSSLILSVVDMEDEVTIGPNTELYISELLQSDDGANKSKLKVWAGSLWFKVKKLVNADDEFVVETPTAVMSVRGSNGYIESMYGQLFAMMASGVLETAPTGGDQAGSDPTPVYPGQQISQLSGQTGDPADTVTPMDIKSFVQNAPPSIIEALLATIQEIREENEQFVQDVGDGTKQVDSKTGLNLSSPDVQQQFGSNLTNLMANIAKEAIDSNKLPAGTVNDLVNKANETGTGEKIDLNNVKPFDATVGLDPAVQQAKLEQMERIQEQKQEQQAQERQAQEEKASQNSALLEQLNTERERQQQGNNEAKEQEQQKANDSFVSGLSQAERERFDSDKQQAQQTINQQQQQQQQNTSGGTGGSTGGTPGGSAGSPGGNAGGTPGGNTGGTPDGSNGGNNGNTGGDDEQTDTTPPDLTVVQPSASPVTVNAISQEIAVYAEQGSSVKLFKGQSATPLETKSGLGAGTKVSFAVNLTEGSNTYKVTATDDAGNATSATVSFVLDTTAPSLTISHPSDETAYVNTKTQTIELTAEEGAAVSLFADSADHTPIQTAAGKGATAIIWMLPDLIEGSNTFVVKATDALGNSVTKTIHYVLNTSGPSLTIVHPTVPNEDPANPSTYYVNNAAQTIQVRTDAGVTVRLYKGEETTPIGTLTGSAAAPVEFADLGLIEGLNRYRVTATDSLGNETTRIVKYLLDTIAPPLTVVQPAGGSADVTSNVQTIQVKAELGANVSLYQGTASGSPKQTGIGKGQDVTEFNVTLTEGSNLFTIVATDAAQNSTEKTVTYQYNPIPPSANEAGLEIVIGDQTVAKSGETTSAAPAQLTESIFDLNVVLNDFDQPFYAVEVHLTYTGAIDWEEDYRDDLAAEGGGDFIFNRNVSESVMNTYTTGEGEGQSTELVYVITQYAKDGATSSDYMRPFPREPKTLVSIPFWADGSTEGTINITDIVIVDENGNRLNKALKGPIYYSVQVTS